MSMDFNIDDIKKSIEDSSNIPSQDDSQAEIEKYNKRKEEIARFKSELKEAEAMDNKNWAQQLLKKSAHNMMVAQNIAASEIEEVPESKRMASMAELSNAITTAAKTVMDIDHAEENLVLAREKNVMRQSEINIKSKIVDADGNTIDDAIGNGSVMDMLKMMASSAHDNEKKELEENIMDIDPTE